MINALCKSQSSDQDDFQMIKIKVRLNIASHTLHRERKGLVTLQLLSYRQGTQLSTITVR